MTGLRRWTRVAVALAALVLGSALVVGCSDEVAGPAGLDEVAVDGGRISGRTDGDLHVFLGVPYAAPPVGDLRWRPPQPVQRWDGVRACRDYGPACPQPGGMIAGVLGVGETSEDCLYLNVWTPARSPDDGLPVMVWIHGGGFTSGSASQSLYDGASLARRGVVVVSVNYRLGAFGFLAHPALSAESADGVSGNYGLRDQVAALEWVRDNIAGFGGDPERVTAFGESAGGMSVAYLMTSPAADGTLPGGDHREWALRRRRLRDGCRSQPHGGRAVRSALRGRPRAGPVGRRGRAARGPGRPPRRGRRRRAAWTRPREPRSRRSSTGTCCQIARRRSSRAASRPRVPLIVGANADEANLFLAGSMSAETVRGLLRRTYGTALDDAERLFPAARYGGERAALSRLATVLGFWAPARFAAAAANRAGAPSYLYLFTRVPDVPVAGRWAPSTGSSCRTCSATACSPST